MLSRIIFLISFSLTATAHAERFVETFESRFGRRPDCVTAQTYDATRLLIAAIRRAVSSSAGFSVNSVRHAQSSALIKA